MTLPNFLIIGEIKAGTTSLYKYCAEHPDIYMPSSKEPRFFSYEPTNSKHFAGKSMRATTMEEYERLFDGVADETAIGEASPQYIHSLNAARRIHEHLPNAKLIACIRNPVDRIYSEYLMLARARTKTRPFIDMFNDSVRSQSWIFKSSFPFQNLSRFYDLFDSSQLKIILFDDLKSNSTTVMKGVYQFLGVDASFIPDTSEIYNKGGVPKNAVLNNILLHIKKKTRGQRGAAIKAILPQPIISYVRKLNQRNMQKAPSLTPQERQEVAAYYQDDIVKLQKLLGRDLSAWLS